LSQSAAFARPANKDTGHKNTVIPADAGMTVFLGTEGQKRYS
jgi:hypothetical protein